MHCCIKGGIGRLLSLLASGVPVDTLQSSYSALVVLAAKGTLPTLDANYDINESLQDGISPLMASSGAGHIHCISVLLQHGANIDQIDSQGRSALFYTIFHNQTEAFSYLLEKGANPNIQDSQKRNILHIAANLGRVTITNTILSLSKQSSNHQLVTQKDNYGCTCLHYAVTQKYEEIAENILQFRSGSDDFDFLNEKDDKGISAFLYACQQKDSEEWVEYLLDEGADIATSDYLGQSALHYSVLTNNNDVIKTLLCFMVENQDFEDLYELLNHRADGGYTPLHYACLTENEELFKILVSAYKKSLVGNQQISLSNLVDNRQRNILHMAAYMNNIELCKLIYKYFPSLCGLSDAQNRSALFYAVKNVETSSRQRPGSNQQQMPYSETCLPVLIDMNLFDCGQRDSKGRNILHYACYYNNLQQVQYLLSLPKGESSESLDTADIHGNTPLHVAASRGFSECVRMLILMGALHMNAIDCFQRTPLHIAIQNKHVSCTQLLVQLGANINCKDYKKRTPLHYACSLELEQSAISENCVQILLQDATKSVVTAADVSGVSPLLMTCAMGNTRTLKEMLHHLLRRASIGPGNEKIEWPESFIDHRQWSPMHYAAYHGHGEILRLLLEYFRVAPASGIPMVEWRECHHMTALHLACAYPSSSLCVKVLLEKLIDTSAPDKLGRTSLHIAASVGNLPTCKILLQMNPRLRSIQDYSKRIPLDYAVQEGMSTDFSSHLKPVESQLSVNTPKKPVQATRTPKKLRKKSISNITVRSRTPLPSKTENPPISVKPIAFSSVVTPKKKKQEKSKSTVRNIPPLGDAATLEDRKPSTPMKSQAQRVCIKRAATPRKREMGTPTKPTASRCPSPGISLRTPKRNPSSTRTPVSKGKEGRNKENVVAEKINYTSFSHPNVFERLNAHAVARNKLRKAREANRQK